MGAVLPTGGAVVQGKEKHRWWGKKKAEVGLRVLRAEDIETVSREVKVPVFALTRWRDEFLAGGGGGTPEAAADRAGAGAASPRAKMGELTMQVEILQELHRNRGLHPTPLRSVHSAQESGGRCSGWGDPLGMARSSY